MGLIASRGTRRGDVIDTSSNNAYKYPPKSGSYFGSYFIMGGTRFESTQTDSYLFGENKDLNFLGSKPTAFPYPAPQAHEPTRTLKSLVNIRKDSLKFVRDTEQDSVGMTSEISEEERSESVVSSATQQQQSETTLVQSNTRYNIEFTFDTDVKCSITIYYFATEEIINKTVVYRPRDPGMNSETFHYKRGANQVFSQPTHFIDPSQFTEDEWQYDIDKDIIPIVIHCVVEEEEHSCHSHMTLAVVERSADGSYVLKPFKQKQVVDGLCYLLQEIYGIENKNTERAKLDDDIDDNGSECVICMSETRDTLILPCRHLCLCNGCADNLRYQANNCPICRAKFRALLQLRAIRKKPTGTAANSRPQPVESTEECPALSQEGVPAGYEAVSLIEALNGPTLPHCAVNVATEGCSPADQPQATRATSNGTVVVLTPDSPPASPTKDLPLVNGKMNGYSHCELEDKEVYDNNEDEDVIIRESIGSASGEGRHNKGVVSLPLRQKKGTSRTPLDLNRSPGRTSLESQGGAEDGVLRKGLNDDDDDEEDDEESSYEDALSKDLDTKSSVSVEVISEIVRTSASSYPLETTTVQYADQTDCKKVNYKDEDVKSDEGSEEEDDEDAQTVSMSDIKPLTEQQSLSSAGSREVKVKADSSHHVTDPLGRHVTDPLGHLVAPLTACPTSESRYSSSSSTKELLSSEDCSMDNVVTLGGLRGSEEDDVESV